MLAVLQVYRARLMAKIAATRAANAGATVAQLEAIFGWQRGSMAALYSRAADRRRLSIEAMSKLGNDKRTSIVAPLYEVRLLREQTSLDDSRPVQ